MDLPAFLEEEVGQRPARQLVPCPRMVQVGKGNGQSPRKSGMRYPGMKLHQNGSIPSFGILLIGGETNSVLISYSPAGSVSAKPER